jgi:dephospho-CoA kinase
MAALPGAEAGVILKVGLTGGIASGKSTILRLFRELGCLTADADSIVARLYQPGQAGHAALVRTYGPSVLTPEGEVDRKKLANIAFATPEASARLNGLIHPIVIAEQARMMSEAEAHGDAVYVIEATLLLESGGKERFDRIVIVDVPRELQIARGVARGLPEAEVVRRIAHQMPRETRLGYADYVVDNSGDETQARAESARVHAALLDDLERKKKRPEPEPGAQGTSSR